MVVVEFTKNRILSGVVVLCRYKVRCCTFDGDPMLFVRDIQDMFVIKGGIPPELVYENLFDGGINKCISYDKFVDALFSIINDNKPDTNTYNLARNLIRHLVNSAICGKLKLH